MASFLSSNGRNSVHFDSIHLEFSTHAYFEVHILSMLSEYGNSKNIFCDVITNELYFICSCSFSR